MAKESQVRPYLIRLGIILVISTVFALAFNEATYLLYKADTDRQPKTIQLVIPPGTAEKVAAGEPVTEIPEEMTFVVGDVLEVKNEDSVAHQLGPIWVPPNSTGKLVMDKAEKLAYDCSFQSTQYLGLDIYTPTTLGTRLTGLVIAAPSIAALLFVYSLAAWPIGKEKKAKLTGAGL